MISPRTTAFAFAALASTAFAAQTVRFSVDQRGDFVLIGNSNTYDCGNTPIAPLVGTVGACGTNTNDSSGDIFWRARGGAGAGKHRHCPGAGAHDGGADAAGRRDGHLRAAVLGSKGHF